MENFAAVAVAFITGVIGPIAVLYIKHVLDSRKKKPDMVMDTLRVSELINQKIDHIRDEFGADRVWISQFHNGGNFYPTGRSMAKFSIMYEAVSANATSVQSNFKNIPVNLFSRSINQLLQNDVIEVADFKDETIATYGLKYVAEESGCKSSYLFAIKTIEDKFIGVLSVEYTKRKTKLNMEDINHISNHASSIGGVLMTYLAQ
jgi:hypothetical protein